MFGKYADVKKPRCPLSGSAWDCRLVAGVLISQSQRRQTGRGNDHEGTTGHKVWTGTGEGTRLPAALTGETVSSWTLFWQVLSGNWARFNELLGIQC